MSNQEPIKITIEGKLQDALARYQLATISFKSCSNEEQREAKRREAYDRAAELAHCLSEAHFDQIMKAESGEQ